MESRLLPQQPLLTRPPPGQKAQAPAPVAPTLWRHRSQTGWRSAATGAAAHRGAHQRRCAAAAAAVEVERWTGGRPPELQQRKAERPAPPAWPRTRCRSAPSQTLRRTHSSDTAAAPPLLRGLRGSAHARATGVHPERHRLRGDRAQQDGAGESHRPQPAGAAAPREGGRQTRTSPLLRPPPAPIRRRRRPASCVAAGARGLLARRQSRRLLRRSRPRPRGSRRGCCL